MKERNAEELDKMAEEAYAKDVQYIGMSANITYKLGFKAGYDKATKELETQIEKMKCCQNCKYYNGGYLKCICKERSYSCNRIFNSGTKDLWEIKEND